MKIDTTPPEYGFSLQELIEMARFFLSSRPPSREEILARRTAIPQRFQPAASTRVLDDLWLTHHAVPNSRPPSPVSIGSRLFATPPAWVLDEPSNYRRSKDPRFRK
jgi:hypothetical protein